MNILIKFLNLGKKENHFSRFKRNLDLIWVVVEEVASVAAMEVEAIDNKNQRRRVKIITKSLESRETPPTKKFIKSSKKWQLNTIQIKIKTIQKELRLNSKRLLMPMKLFMTKKKEKFMMFMEKRVFNKTNNKKDHMEVEITISFSSNSLVEVVDSMEVVVVATRNKFMRTYLKIQMWRN